MNDAECPAFLDLYQSAAPSELGWTLDLGAGSGRLVPNDSRRRWLGFDLRRRALRQAARAMLAKGHALHQGDAHRLPYRDEAFTAVVSNSLLHHVPRPEEVLAESVRVLAPGGLLLFRDLLPGNLQSSAALSAWPVRLLGQTEVAGLVAQLGFPQASVSRHGRHWVWLALKPRIAESTA